MPTRKGSKTAGEAPGSLKKYHSMRDFGQTPEPRGREGSKGKRLSFVIQKHSATRLHYDFRLEAAGVLASWAIPKGPTLDTKERRLAMHVEDHPLEYGKFEGNIPKGQYGGGPVILWDNGWYELAEGDDAAKEIGNGKIKFIMHGKRMKGMFTLVRIKGRDEDGGDPWLLIKDHDKYVQPGYDAADETTSVKSGKTIDEMRADASAATWNSKPRSERAKRARHASATPLPVITSPMLATVVDEPFDSDEWLFEIKWDGYRAIVTIDEKGKLTVVSRNGNDLLSRFPDMEDLAGAFTSVPIVVDGEIVSLDDEGKSSFQRLQYYEQERVPLHFMAFDVLYADGRDVRDQPVEERKELLERLIRDDTLVMYSKHVVGNGKALFKHVQDAGLEGIIAKRLGSTYQMRRSRDWLKIKAQNEQEFVVGGWTEPKGSRKGFGALLLGVYEGKKLRYVGSVGTGFGHKLLADLTKKLKANERETSPFDGPVVANAPTHWTKPEMVAQVRFTEWTRDDLLRQPAFLGMRTDKDARDVVRERASGDGEV